MVGSDPGLWEVRDFERPIAICGWRRGARNRSTPESGSALIGEYSAMAGIDPHGPHEIDVMRLTKADEKVG